MYTYIYIHICIYIYIHIYIHIYIYKHWLFGGASKLLTDSDGTRSRGNKKARGIAVPGLGQLQRCLFEVLFLGSIPLSWETTLW